MGHRRELRGSRVSLVMWPKRIICERKSQKRENSTPFVGPHGNDVREGRRWFWIRVRKLLYASCAKGKFTSAPVATSIIKNTIRDGKSFDWRFYLVLRDFLVCLSAFRYLQLFVEVGYLAVGDESTLNFEIRIFLVFGGSFAHFWICNR